VVAQKEMRRRYLEGPCWSCNGLSKPTVYFKFIWRMDVVSNYGTVLQN